MFFKQKTRAAELYRTGSAYVMLGVIKVKGGDHSHRVRLVRVDGPVASAQKWSNHAWRANQIVPVH